MCAVENVYLINNLLNFVVFSAIMTKKRGQGAWIILS